MTVANSAATVSSFVPSLYVRSIPSPAVNKLETRSSTFSSNATPPIVIAVASRLPVTSSGLFATHLSPVAA